jgi:hypothetical protein
LESLTTRTTRTSVPESKKNWQGLLPEHLPEDVPKRQAALLREPINISFGNNILRW